nr:MAG TPA: hypothetical protein [Caudoviricetes sp.]
MSIALDALDYSTFETVCQELFSSAGNFRLPAPSSLLPDCRYALPVLV